MSTFLRTGLVVAALGGLASAGIVAAADEAGQRGCAGEHQAGAQGEHKGHAMERMSEMHKRMQSGEHRHQGGGEQKPGGAQKQDRPQGGEHDHS